MRQGLGNFLVQAAAAEAMAAQHMQQLAARGYRRVSNRYGTLARVDRSDWLEVLAKNLGRSVAELYDPQTKQPAAHWCDFYRRSHLCNDRIDVEPPALAQLVPSSGGDAVGFVDAKLVEEVARG